MHTKNTLLAAVAALTCSSSLLAAPADAPANGRPAAPAPIEGSWIVSIRPVFCSGPTAGNDVPGITPVVSLLTFGRGGTLIESSSNPNFGPGRRSSGHGAWERTGRTSYQYTMAAFLLSPEAPYQTGQQRIDQTVEMHSDDDWTSTGPVQFFNVFDRTATPDLPPYRAGCARASAVRMY